MIRLVLVRHGLSAWNKENRFTGWTDVDLADEGVLEARAAGEKLKAAGFHFDLAYTSYLKRAVKTLWEILNVMDLAWIEERKNWRLNERHYGDLQGFNKEEKAQEVGEEQVKLWRRSYDVAPPALSSSDPRSSRNDPRYAALKPEEIPLTESLKDTIEGFVPCWENEIALALKSGRQVIVVAHGNSLRGLVQHLEGLTPEQVLELNIPTAQPLVYELDENLKPIRSYSL